MPVEEFRVPASNTDCRKKVGCCNEQQNELSSGKSKLVSVVML